MVNVHFFDSYALIEILKDNPNYRKYSEEPIITSPLNLGESYYAYLKIGRQLEFFRAVDGMNIEVISVTSDDCYQAMTFRY